MWTANATTVAGSSTGLAGSTASLLYYPKDVFADNRGALYVSDSNNYRVQKWLPGATNGSTVAGGSNGAGLNQLGGGGKLCILYYVQRHLSLLLFK